MKVRDVKPKHINGYGNVLTRTDFKKNVEDPCLNACLWFYDLNIMTTTCNCNCENPLVDLAFEGSSLSEENRIIAEELARKGILVHDDRYDWYRIEFPASLEDDVYEISNKLLSIAIKFKYQDVLSSSWVMSKKNFFESEIYDEDEKLHELCRKYNLNISCLRDLDIEFNDEGLIVSMDGGVCETLGDNLNDFFIDFEEILNAQYDSIAENEPETLYRNSELYQKHLEYVELQKGRGK